MRKNSRVRRKVISTRMRSKVKIYRSRVISKRSKRVISKNSRARTDSTKKTKRERCPWRKNRINNQWMQVCYLYKYNKQ